MFGLHKHLQAEFGAANFEMNTLKGVTSFDVHEPFTVNAERVAEAMRRSNYTLKSVVIARPGQPERRVDY